MLKKDLEKLVEEQISRNQTLLTELVWAENTIMEYEEMPCVRFCRWLQQVKLWVMGLFTRL